MQDFLTFVSGLLSSVSGFLMSEPVCWFVGVFLVGGVGQLVHYIINKNL